MISRRKALSSLGLATAFGLIALPAMMASFPAFGGTFSHQRYLGPPCR